MKKKRIIFVHFFNSFTGSPQVLRTVIESLEAYEIILITNKSEGFLSGLDIEYRHFDFRLSNNKLRTLLNYFSAQFTIFCKVLFLIKKSDLLYVNTVIPVFAAFAARMKGAKILFHLHEDRISLNFIHRFLSFFRRYCCDHEIFVSQYLYRQEHILGIKYHVLPNVLSKFFLDNARNTRLTDKTNPEFNILMICSLKKYKGVFEFLRIAEKLSKENDINFTLVVSESNVYIESYFSATAIPRNVEIHGKTNNTITYYKQAAILLNLSRVDEWIETFGLTILEGMSFGLPCIVPPVGGPTDLIEEGVNGYQISSYDQDKIVASILSLRDDKELYNRISVNNKMRALDFSNEAFKKKLNEIINQI